MPARRCMAFGEGALEAEVHACLVRGCVTYHRRAPESGGSVGGLVLL